MSSILARRGGGILPGPAAAALFTAPAPTPLPSAGGIPLASRAGGGAGGNGILLDEAENDDGMDVDLAQRLNVSDTSNPAGASSREGGASASHDHTELPSNGMEVDGVAPDASNV